MARDTERYVYLTIGIPRDSPTYPMLLQDAQDNGMHNEIAKLVVLRLGDFYRQTNTAILTRTVQPKPVEALPETTMNEDQAALNASAALDEWG